MNETANERLRQIKHRFFLRMNGTASSSMRDKGLNYGINWGIALPELKHMAAEYGKDYELAILLWRENIRECKILATMMMPPKDFLADIMDLWVSQIPTQEIAEMLAFNLLQHVEEVKDYALVWISSDNDNIRICGYNVLSRIIGGGKWLVQRDMDELIDQALAEWKDGSLPVRHAIKNVFVRVEEMGGEYSKSLSYALKNNDLDIF